MTGQSENSSGTSENSNEYDNIYRKWEGTVTGGGDIKGGGTWEGGIIEGFEW